MCAVEKSTPRATRPSSAGTIVYDGECAFCLRQVERVRAKDIHGLFECVPQQAPGLFDRFPALAEADLDSGMRLIQPDGQIHVGPDAVYEIARRLPSWRRLAWLYRLPLLHRVFVAGYAWIAANRYRLAGKCREGRCALPHQTKDT